MAFLDSCFAKFGEHDRQDIIRYIQQLLIYCLLFKRTDLALLLLGRGNNGKSTFLDILRRLVGADYCAAFEVKKSDSQFSGSRMEHRKVVIDDDNTMAYIPENIIKRFSGNRVVEVERKGVDAVDTLNTCLLIIASNKSPKFKEADEGLRRRLVVLPFNKQLAQGEIEAVQDRIGHGLDLGEYICQHEMPGVLNFALAGLCELHRNRYKLSGYCVPEVLAKARAQMFNESNAVGSFLSRFIRITAEMEGWKGGKYNPVGDRPKGGRTQRIDAISVRALYEIFTIWAQGSENIEHIKTRAAFIESVEHYGLFPGSYGSGGKLHFLGGVVMVSELVEDIGTNYLLEDHAHIACELEKWKEGEALYRADEI